MNISMTRDELSSAKSFTGENAELFDVLNARERRVHIQQDLLSDKVPALVSFTLNIPGPVKVLPLVPEAFALGLSSIGKRLQDHGFAVTGRKLLFDKTGLEAFLSVDAPPRDVKAALVPLEEETRLGRLYDIDVIGPDGTKVSREDLGLPGRTCLLCGRPARECSRSRAHSVEELTSEITTILKGQPAWHLTEL